MPVTVISINIKQCRHVEQASIEWLQAKHATNQLLGKVELLFRPFLRWLDRSLERLFTEGARQVRLQLYVCSSFLGIVIVWFLFVYVEMYL